jgi:NAD(P)-dependent dehydrogenase (short-subunit alcohol dehydrogenase family)
MASSANPMQGQVCMVTGATSDIGLVAAQALARQGATVNDWALLVWRALDGMHPKVIENFGQLLLPALIVDDAIKA